MVDIDKIIEEVSKEMRKDETSSDSGYMKGAETALLLVKVKFDMENQKEKTERDSK